MLGRDFICPVKTVQWGAYGQDHKGSRVVGKKAGQKAASAAARPKSAPSRRPIPPAGRGTVPAKPPVPPAPAASPPRQDDAAITALKLPAAKLSPAMEAYFKKCQEKLGFVPNVLLAYAFDNAKLEAFAAMYNDLMLAPSGLSKLEREMIAVAVSSQNRCYYCLVAHGAAVRPIQAIRRWANWSR